MPRAKRASGFLPGTNHTRSGVFPTITGSVDSSSPTMKATRYVDIRMVSAKTTAFLPGPPGDSLTTAALEMAASPSGTTRVTPNTALQAGSSQHGKPRRASVDSNCVAAITCDAPAASL